jgi:hypothetical protein
VTVKGEHVLRALVALTYRPHADRSLEAAASSARIAGWIQGELGVDAQPRQVAARLRALEAAHLCNGGMPARRLKRDGRIKVARSGGKVWSPTARGREVDATLERIRPTRGGIFAPHTAVGITISETLALR